MVTLETTEARVGRRKGAEGLASVAEGGRSPSLWCACSDPNRTRPEVQLLTAQKMAQIPGLNHHPVTGQITYSRNS